jgi:acyl-CoA synthetase (NDP forming)
MCRQAGIIMVETMDDMVDVAGMLLSQPRPQGKRVGIITLGGGWGVLATDLCLRYGLEVPPLNSKLIELIDAILPSYWSKGNPVDLVAPGKISSITDAARILLDDSSMDAVLMLGLGYVSLRANRWLSSPVLPPQNVEDRATATIRAEVQLLDLLMEQIRETRKPIVPVVDIAIRDEVMEVNPAHYLENHGIMVYSAPDQAIMALACVTDYYHRIQSAS